MTKEEKDRLIGLLNLLYQYIKTDEEINLLALTGQMELEGTISLSEETIVDRFILRTCFDFMGTKSFVLEQIEKLKKEE